MLWASVSAVSGSECAGTLTTTQDTQASQAWDCRMPRSPTKVKRLFQSHGINSLTSSRGLRGDKDRVLPLRCNDAAEGDLREVSHNIRISSHEWHGELRIVTVFFPVSSMFFLDLLKFFEEWSHLPSSMNPTCHRVRPGSPGPAKGRQHLRGFRRRPGVRRYYGTWQPLSKCNTVQSNRNVSNLSNLSKQTEADFGKSLECSKWMITFSKQRGWKQKNNKERLRWDEERKRKPFTHQISQRPKTPEPSHLPKLGNVFWAASPQAEQAHGVRKLIILKAPWQLGNRMIQSKKHPTQAMYLLIWSLQKYFSQTETN